MSMKSPALAAVLLALPAAAKPPELADRVEAPRPAACHDYSFAFYDHGLAMARAAGRGFTRVALWREVGTLGGICIATLAPTALAGVLGPALAYTVYAAGSGAALGADLTLPPAMLAARIEGDGGRVFALWTFLQKSALATAAGVALPALALAGYDPAAPTDPGRATLTIGYALVLCALKLAAIAALVLIPDDPVPHDKEPVHAHP